MKRILLSLLSLLLLTSSAVVFAPSVAAAYQSVTVDVRPVDSETQSSITDACFVIVNISNEGCDENGDGYIAFQDIAPGTYALTQTRDAAGYVSIGTTSISVNADSPEQVIFVPLQRASTTTSTAKHFNFNISIVALDDTTGVAIPGACFIINNASLEGCDENGDGQVTFDAIPAGTYSVHQTKSPNGYAIQADQSIVVSQDGPLPFLQGKRSNIVTGGGTSTGNTVLVDVSLVTRSPSSGDLLTGTCYVILNASIEGCDENGDGQVDFADVVPGEYMVHQTKTPGGSTTPHDFRILITRDPIQSFIVKQAAEQNDSSHRNVSIVLLDRQTGIRVTGKNVCAQIANAGGNTVSNVGCDDNSDGQIDFLDIPTGSQTVTIASAPAGYDIQNTTYGLAVSPDYPYSIVIQVLPLSRK
jgi:uncharacterized surface anchored protein